jgi:hypothetical protein
MGFPALIPGFHPEFPAKLQQLKHHLSQVKKHKNTSMKKIPFVV